jgi:hypothetical protein
MAEQSVDHHLDIGAHRSTYSAFVRGAIVLSFVCALVLVALCSFAFGKSLNVFIGFAGLIIGIAALLVDARSGSQRWFLSLGVLVLFGLITAVNVG